METVCWLELAFFRARARGGLEEKINNQRESINNKQQTVVFCEGHSRRYPLLSETVPL